MADPGGDVPPLRVGAPAASVLALSGAEVVLRGDRRQAWRAMMPSLPFVALAAIATVAGSWVAAAYLGLLASGWTLRALWWRATGGSVQVISADDVLISVQDGRVRRWVRWSDVDEIVLLRPSWVDPWQRFPRGAAVHVDFLRLQPPQAFATHLATPLLAPSSFDRDVTRLRTIARARGVRVRELD